jgi:hypothetical protein
MPAMRLFTLLQHPSWNELHAAQRRTAVQQTQHKLHAMQGRAVCHNAGASDICHGASHYHDAAKGSMLCSCFMALLTWHGHHHINAFFYHGPCGMNVVLLRVPCLQVR